MSSEKSPLERFAATCDTSEIWWDSSPLVYDSWSKRVIDGAGTARKETLSAWHGRYYTEENPDEQLFRGCTTNPPLTLAAIRERPRFWKAWTIELRRRNPNASVNELWWLLYLELIKRAAEGYLGTFNRSGFRFGYVTGQVLHVSGASVM